MTSPEKLQQYNSTSFSRLPLPSLGLRVSERKLLLLTFDLFLLNASLFLSVYFLTDLLPDRRVPFWALKWFITLSLLYVILASAFDAYNLARAASIPYTLRAVIPAAGLTCLLYFAIPWLTPRVETRLQAFTFVGMAVGATALWRFIYARLFVQPAFQHRALVVGAGQSGRALAQALREQQVHKDPNPFRGAGYRLLGFIDDDPARHEQAILGIPVLGCSQKLLEAVRALNVDEVIISITHAHQIRPELFKALLSCRELGIPVTSMPTVYERLTGRVAIHHASRNLEIAAGYDDNPFRRFYGLFKRASDFTLSLIGLLALILAIPLVALANRLLSPGPLFFRQTRVGCGGKPYTVIKFRSMIPDAEQHCGPVWARRDDERITPFGRWLRRTHLDELPQVINVLRGEMSIVGPRPERPQFVDRLSDTIPFYRARHAVRPGITGWAQIHQDYGDSFERAQEKVEYDLYYVKHANPLLDLHIILRTVSKVLTLRGR